MTLRRCTRARCGALHALPHSALCPLCWGDVIGCVPGDPADDVEVCDEGGEHA